MRTLFKLMFLGAMLTFGLVSLVALSVAYNFMTPERVIDELGAAVKAGNLETLNELVSLNVKRRDDYIMAYMAVDQILGAASVGKYDELYRQANRLIEVKQVSDELTDKGQYIVTLGVRHPSDKLLRAANNAYLLDTMLSLSTRPPDQKLMDHFMDELGIYLKDVATVYETVPHSKSRSVKLILEWEWESVDWRFREWR